MMVWLHFFPPRGVGTRSTSSTAVMTRYVQRYLVATFKKHIAFTDWTVKVLASVDAEYTLPLDH